MQLTPVQREMVEETEHNCCALSIPGSGKTTVIIAKLAAIMRANRSATAVTFTAEAGHELTKRLGKLDLAASQLQRLQSGTFHALTLRRLRELQGKELQQRSIAKAGECRTMMARAIEHGCGSVTEFLIREMDQWRATVDPLAQDFGCLEEFGFGGSDAREAVADTLNEYMRLMREAGLIDFTEIMWRGLELMRGWRGARFYANEQEAPLRRDGIPIFSGGHVLVDEMQDIDEVQLEFMLLHYFSLGATVDGVGDDDQSIYRFRRGLGIKGMRRFIDLTDAKMLKMDTNFRCRSEILAWAGSVIAQNVDREPKELKAFRGAGGEVRLLAVKSGGAPELERVAQMITADLAQHSIETIAVLARGNKKLQDMEGELQKRGIDSRLIGAKSMWEDDPLCLWVSALSEWGRSGLGEGLRSLLYWCGCNQTDLMKLTTGLSGSMFWQADFRSMDLSGKGLDIAESLSHHWYQMHKTDWTDSAAAAKVLLDCAEEIGARTGGSNVAAQNDEGIVSSKMTAAAEILSRTPGTPRQRALWVKGLEKRARESDARVKLVSMHSSKGLEFDSVYIINATERSLPGQAFGAEIEEERRVLYVAMTRAKNKLTISYTQDSRNKPTPFLLSHLSPVIPIDADNVLEQVQADSRFAERATTG